MVLVSNKQTFPHHFLVCGLAVHLKDHLALGHPLADAVMDLPLLVLCLPHGGVLSPALNTGIATTLGGGAGSQAKTTDNKET